MADGMRSLEDGVPWRHLIGLEQRLKPHDVIRARVAEDLRVKGRTVEEAFAILGDGNRYTFQYPEGAYTQGVVADLRRLAGYGFTEVRRRNAWTWPEHKGIVSCWREPASGTLFEVQFHTRPSYEAWQLTHPAYERLRDPATCDTERGELKAFIRTVYGVFGAERSPAPAGADTVTYYAVVDSLSSRAEPAGVLRRIAHASGQRDEAFGYDLAWRPTFLLYSAERGNLDNTVRQISVGAADQVTQRITQLAAERP